MFCFLTCTPIIVPIITSQLYWKTSSFTLFQQSLWLKPDAALNRLCEQPAVRKFNTGRLFSLNPFETILKGNRETKNKFEYFLIKHRQQNRFIIQRIFFSNEKKSPDATKPQRETELMSTWNPPPWLTAAEQRNYCAHCQNDCEVRGQTQTLSLSLSRMTALTALCSLRQAERNPYAHHKDCTISQLAGGAGQQIMTAAEPFKSSP